VVPSSEIETNDFNLNISRYVHLGEEAEEVDVAAEVEKLVELQAERDAAEARMMGFLQELGYVA
jgi:type I restriction enzyme M protein